jgi:60 kDa SS-A/Ro ribonucleoprotein
MGTKAYATATNTQQTSQMQPVFGKNQVANSEGGYVFKLDDWKQMERFLILGSEGGTYYIKEQKLTADNAASVLRCVQTDGIRAVNAIVDVSTRGRAPKNDPALLALAIAASAGDDKTRAYALAKLPEVARIGTHLQHFCEFINGMRGWGRGLRNGVAAWYQNRPADKLAYDVCKYRQRDGWAHRDILRLAHPEPQDSAQASVLRWVTAHDNTGDRVVSRAKDGSRTKTYAGVGATPDILVGFDKAQKSESASETAKLISDYGLTHEMILPDHKNSPEVWEALLQNTPLTAMIRNLGKMSQVELLKPLSAASKTVVNALSNGDNLRKSRVHPLQVLLAMATYESGHGLKGSLLWKPVPQIVDALDSAFYAAFENAPSTGKNFFIGVDVSGSMSSRFTDSPISACQAAAAMAMLIARKEPNYYIRGFCDRLVDLGITAKDSLTAATDKAQRNNFGRTDCSQPILDAIEQKLDVDVFVVITDNETYAGKIHPFQALKQYRKVSGRSAKLAVIGTDANPFTIADPSDAGMMDFVGFDASVPVVLADFATS